MSCLVILNQSLYRNKITSHLGSITKNQNHLQLTVFTLSSAMSIAFKKTNFRVEIRRENLTKILQQKRLQQFGHTEVNRVILQYLDEYPHCQIPKICVLKYELIDEYFLVRLIEVLRENSFQIDIKKTFNIALLNKVFSYEKTLTNKYFDSVTEFAERILFAFPGQNEMLSKENRKEPQKLYLKPPTNLIDDIMYLPNCLIEYWGNFFSNSKQGTNLCMRSYCTVMKCFIKWFSLKGTTYHNFSKYSVCFFLRNFFQTESIYMPQTYDKNQIYKQVEELYIRFRITSISIVLKLLQEQFYCQELIHLMKIIKDRLMLSNDMLRIFNQSQRQNNFFQMILDGIDNQNILISKDSSIKQRFFHAESLTQSNLKILSELSIQSILKQDVSQTIWKCKTSILDIFNQFLTINHFNNLFYQGPIEKILQKLINVYTYSTQNGQITSRIQKTICIIFYNIILLSETQFDSEDEETCLKLHNEDQTPIQQNLTDFFVSKLDYLSEIVIKTQYTAYDHIVEMISLMKCFSEFLYTKEVDQKIMDQGGLVMRVCQAFQKNVYSQEQGKKIMDSLFDYLDQLNDQSFDFSSTFRDIQKLKKTQFTMFLVQNQQNLLDEILKPFVSQDPSN